MGTPVVVLDIGASKIHCMVGEAVDDLGLKILGMGLSPCDGIRRNVVIDMPKMVEAIRSSVQEAERSAGLKIAGAYVGVAGQDVATHTSRSTVAISGSSNPIDENDVHRALVAAEEASFPGNTTVLHRFVQRYAVDGEPVQNPMWLHGSRLEVETLSTTAPSHVCTTLRRAVSQVGVDIAGFILEAVAVGSSLLSIDEKEMGVGVLDVGAGTSDLSTYRGSLRHLAEIPFGGEDITKDLSVVLNMSPREAERLKLEQGIVCCPAEEADETISFRTTAGRTHTLVKHQLSAVIEARQQEILEFVAKELERSQQGHLLAAGMVLTGGGALLTNIDQLAEEILGMPVRIGTPQEVVAPEAIEPTYATAVGLLNFATTQHDSTGGIIHSPETGGGGILDRISRIFSFLM